MAKRSLLSEKSSYIYIQYGERIMESEVSGACEVKG